MCTIDIGIRHNDNFVIAELIYIKIISISFKETTAE